MVCFSPQSPNAVVMIRPHHFAPNEETAADNMFQRSATTDVSKEAYAACTKAVETLREKGVRVHVFEDESGLHPDSIFPNNWFSTHSGGRVAVYPMYAASRRGERRYDVLEFLKEHYRVQEVIDYSGLEQDALFLEGTGAMVIDHITRIAFCARSKRCDPLLVERFCTAFGYEPVVFDAVDPNDIPVYHTNVLMCVGTDFAMVGLSAIVSEERRNEVTTRLKDSGREVIELSTEQLNSFAGNALELRNDDGDTFLVISKTGYESLTAEQIATVEKYAEFVVLDVEPIELAGGSIRCMIASLHLDPRPSIAQA